MKNLLRIIILTLLSFSFLLSQSEEIANILRLNKGKVVQIKVKGKKKEDIRTINGFLIEGGKFLVTNLHSLSGGASITAETGDGVKLEPIGIFAYSKIFDNSLIHLKRKDASSFELADLKTLSPGEKVYTISLKDIKNPQIVEGNITTIIELPGDLTLFLLSFSCSKSFDGAPLFNGSGDVVGIVNNIGDEDSSIAVSAKSIFPVLKIQGESLKGEDFLSSTELKLFHGISLIHNSKNAKALQILNEISSSDPDNPFIHYYLGTLKDAESQRDEALNFYHKAIQLKPDFAEVYIKIGSVYEKLGQHEKAIENYKNALKVKLFPEAYYSLGLLYERIGKTDDAIESYKNYISTKPEYAYRGYSRLSVLYRTSGRFKEAMESAQKVLEKFPEDIDANYTLSFSAEKLGEIDKAVDGYLKLMKIDQKRTSEYYGYAVNALMKAEKYQKIVEISKEFTRNLPTNSSGWLNLGTAYLKMEDFQNAVDALSTGAKIEPSNFSIHYNLGIAYVKLGLMKDAMNCFKECLKIKPNDIYALYHLGISSFQAGNLSEAKDALNTYLKINPNDVNAHFNLALILMKLQDFDSASNQLREVLRLDPKHTQAKYNLGLSLFSKKDYKGAIDTFNSFLASHPNEINALYNLALSYLMEGLHSEAIKTFKKVISIEPNNALAHYNLGYTYLLVKNKFGALEEYEKLQKLNPDLARKLKSFIDKVKE